MTKKASELKVGDLLRAKTRTLAGMVTRVNLHPDAVTYSWKQLKDGATRISIRGLEDSIEVVE